MNSVGVRAVAVLVAGEENTEEFSGSKTDLSFRSIIVAFWKHYSIDHAIKEYSLVIIVADDRFGSRFAFPTLREFEMIYVRGVVWTEER